MKRLTSKHPLPKYLFAAGAAVGGAATASEAQAATFYVNSTADFRIDDVTAKQNEITDTSKCTLREALQNAFDLANGLPLTFPGVGTCTPVGAHDPNGDTISFEKFPAGGVISIDVSKGENPFRISTNLIIDGFHVGLNRPTIGGVKQSRVFQITASRDVTLRNLHVTQGRVDPAGGVGAGGGLLVDAAGDTTIEECHFSENLAAHGGAIFLTGGTASIWNTDFVGNVAEYRGGALAGWSKPLVITQSKFVVNSAAGGGAIYIRSGEGNVTISEAEFLSNVASGEIFPAAGIDHNGGGAIMVEAKITVDSTLFEHNRVIGGPREKTNQIGGGAVYVTPSLQFQVATLKNSSFVNNTAAVAEDDDDTPKEACGGAIYAGGRTEIDRCNISDNSAKCAMGGGGVFVRATSNLVTIVNTQFAENTAFEGGIFLPKLGYIYKGGADGYGGALSVNASTKVSVVNSTFKDDYGKSEVASLASSKLYLKNNVFASMNAKETCDKDSPNTSIIFGFHDTNKSWAQDNALGYNFESQQDSIMSNAEPSCNTNIHDLGGWLSVPGTNVPPPGGTPIQFQTHSPKISYPGDGAACIDPSGANGKDLVGTTRSFDICTVGALE